MTAVTFDELGALRNRDASRAEQLAAWCLMLRPGQTMYFEEHFQTPFEMYKHHADTFMPPLDALVSRDAWDGYRRLCSDGNHGSGNRGVRVSSLEVFTLEACREFARVRSEFYRKGRVILTLTRSEDGDKITAKVCRPQPRKRY